MRKVKFPNAKVAHAPNRFQPGFDVEFRWNEWRHRWSIIQAHPSDIAADPTTSSDEARVYTALRGGAFDAQPTKDMTVRIMRGLERFITSREIGPVRIFL